MPRNPGQDFKISEELTRENKEFFATLLSKAKAIAKILGSNVNAEDGLSYAPAINLIRVVQSEFGIQELTVESMGVMVEMVQNLSEEDKVRLRSKLDES